MKNADFRSFGLIFIISAMALSGNKAQAAENPLFARSHLLPSPYTLPAGRLALGTSVALGVTDFFQVGTDLLRDFYKIYNINGKLSLVDYPDFALALTASFEKYNLKDIHPSNPDLEISSTLPGLVTAYAVHDRVALFLGGNLNFTSTSLRTNGIETSGYVRGATLNSDIAWAYNPAPRARARTSGDEPKLGLAGRGNSLAAGFSYDVNYDIYGVGLSHHWPGYQIGFHYYPNAEENQLLPIISGGLAVDI